MCSALEIASIKTVAIRGHWHRLHPHGASYAPRCDARSDMSSELLEERNYAGLAIFDCQTCPGVILL